MKIIDEIELHAALAGGLAFVITIALAGAVKAHSGAWLFDGALAGSVVSFVIVQFLFLFHVMDMKMFKRSNSDCLRFLMVNESLWILLIIACATRQYLL